MKKLYLLLVVTSLFSLSSCYQDDPHFPPTNSNRNPAPSNEWETVTGEPSSSTNSIAVAENDIKLIGTNNAGMGQLSANSFIWTYYDENNSSIPTNEIRSIAIAPNGVIWIGTYGSGLVSLDGETFTEFNSTNSTIATDFVEEIAIDNAGNIWFAGVTTGLSKYDGSTFEQFTVANSNIPSNGVNHIFIDKTDTLYVSTQAGLGKFDGISSWSVTNSGNSILGQNQVELSGISGEGQFIATQDSGIYLFDTDTTFILWSEQNTGFPLQDFSDIEFSNDETAWIGMINTFGLIEITNNTLTSYVPQNSGLINGTIHDIAIDSRGNKWLATNSGLVVYNAGGVIW